MRFLLAALPALLLAQTPATKAPATAAPKPAAAKPATTTPPAATPKPITGAKPAAPKPAAAAKPAAPKPAGKVPVTDDEKTIYSLGLLMQRSLSQFDLSPAELELVKQALTDANSGKPAVDLHEWGPKIEGFRAGRANRASEKEKVAARAFATKAAAESGAVKTDSGLVYKDISVGTGASPKLTDTVKVHYRGTLINGTEFDSSYKRNEPAQFQLTGVIKCWTEGLQRMKIGGKAKLLCPSDIAYGDQGKPPIPGGATLLFEVELLEIAAAK